MKKTILITGASSGIGLETSRYFAEKGWQVAATMRSPEKETDLASLPNVRLYKLDVTDKENIQSLLTTVAQDYKRVDVLLNNAGYSAVGPFEYSSEEAVKRQFQVNVFGVMDLSRAFIPYFRKQGHGCIINITSVGGKMTFPFYSLYNSTKWAVEGFAESLQYELRNFNIKVKVVEPGPIRSEFYGRSQKNLESPEQNPYEQFQKRVEQNMQKMGNNAPGPRIVAKTIYKAATDGSNRLRYPAGNEARLILVLRKLLPSRLFNKIVHKVQAKPSKTS